MVNVQFRKLLYKREHTQSGTPRVLESCKGHLLRFSEFPTDSISGDVLSQHLTDEESFDGLISEEIEAGDVISNAEKKAAAIIDAAEKRAHEYLLVEQKKAIEESKRIIQEAKTKAQQESNDIRKTARDEVYKSYESAMTALKQAAKSLNDYRSNHLQSVEKEIVTIIGAVARKLLHREISVSPGCIADVVSDSLKYFDSKAHLVVKVSPDNHRSISEDPLFNKRFSELGLSVKQVELIPDAKIKKGTVIVTDRFVTFEHDFDTLLENVINDALARCESDTTDELSENVQEG